METATNLLSRPSLPPHYQTISSPTVGLPTHHPSSASPHDARRPLNGWNYNGEPTPALLPHGGCTNFTPYASPLGVAVGHQPPHKVGYSTFGGPPASLGGGPGGPPSGHPGAGGAGPPPDFLPPPHCQQLQLHAAAAASSQLNPLNSLSRNLPNFPFYGDMYQPNHPGMSGSGLFSDFTALPAMPRFDADPAPPYMNEQNAPNSGERPLTGRHSPALTASPADTHRWTVTGRYSPADTHRHSPADTHQRAITSRHQSEDTKRQTLTSRHWPHSPADTH